MSPDEFMAALEAVNNPKLKQPDNPLLNYKVNDGDTINNNRLVSQNGSVFDAYEKGRYDYTGKAAKQQELRLLAQRQHLDTVNKQPAGTSTEADVFAKGVEHIKRLQGALDNGATVNDTRQKDYYGRGKVTVDNPDGSDFTAEHNTPEGNAGYYAPYNAAHRIMGTMAPTVEDERLSSENALKRIAAANRAAGLRRTSDDKKARLQAKGYGIEGVESKADLDAALGKTADSEFGTVAGEANQLLSSFAAGLHHAGSRVVTTPTALKTASVLSNVTPEDLAMYQDIKKAESNGVPLTDVQTLFKEGKTFDSDGPNFKGVKVFDALKDAESAQDFTDTVIDNTTDMGDALVNRSRQQAMQQDVGKDFDKASEAYEVAKQAWDKGDYVTAATEVLNTFQNGVEGVATALFDHPAAVINTAVESVPGMAVAIANLPIAIITGSGDYIGRNIKTFETDNGRLPNQDEAGVLIASSVAASVLENVGDRLIGKGIKGTEAREIIKNLTNPEKAAVSMAAKLAGTTPGKFLNGAITEFVSEGSTDVLNQFAVKQDVDDIDGKQAYTSAAIGAAAGGVTKTVIDKGTAIAGVTDHVLTNPEYSPEAEPLENLRALTGEGAVGDRATIVRETDRMVAELGSKPELASEYQKYSDVADGLTLKATEDQIKAGDTNDGTIASVLTLGSKAPKLLEQLPDSPQKKWAMKQAESIPDMPVEKGRGMKEHIRSVTAAIESDGDVGTALADMQEYRNGLTNPKQIQAADENIAFLNTLTSESFASRLKGDGTNADAPDINTVPGSNTEGADLQVIADAESGVTANMSPQDSYAHETAYTMFSEGAKKLPAVRRQLKKLSLLAQRTLGDDGYKLFLNHDADGNPVFLHDRATEVAEAKEQFNEAMRDPVRFATYVQTNPAFKKAMGDTEVSRVFNGLTQRFLQPKTITGEIGKVQQTLARQRDSYLPDVNHAMSTAIGKVVQPFAQAIDNTLKVSDGSFRKEVNRLAERLGKTRQDDSYQLLKDFQGATDKNLPWHKLLRRASAYKEESRHIGKEMTRFITGSFSRDITDSEWQAVHHAALKADLSVLGNDPDTLISALNNPEGSAESVRQAIRDQFPEQAEQYIKQAEGLGRYMARGEIGNDRQMLNAHNIANLLHLDGQSNLDIDVETAEQMIGQLSTLSALNHTSEDSRRLTAQLVATEQDGFNVLLDLHGQQKAEALEKLFKGDKTATIAGWTKEETDPSVQTEVRPRSEEAEMKKQGYKLVGDVQSDANDSIRGMALYVKRSRNDRTTGLLGAGKHSKGNYAGDQEAIRIGSGLGVNDASDFNRNHAVPVMSNGKIQNFRYLMNEDTRRKLHGGNNKANEVLGNMLANTTAVQNRDSMDKLIVQQAKDDFDQHYADDPKRFVKVGKDSEMYKLLSKEMKNQLAEVWGDSEFYLQEELLNLVGGISKLSATRNLPALVQPLVNRMAEFQEKVAATAKRHIVMYTPEVVASNISSNFISTVLLTGASPFDVGRLQREGLELFREYEDTTNKLTLAKKGYGDNGKLSNQAKQTLIAKLEKDLAANPVTPLVREGFFSGNTEDLADGDGRLLPKQLYSNRVESLTTRADPMGKYAMYRILTDAKGMNHDEAIQRSMEVFVDYNPGQIKSMEYLNRKGTLPFMKYAVRILRPVLRALREKPASVAMAELIDRNIADMPDVFDGGDPGKFGAHRIITPEQTVQDAIEFPAIRVLDVFGS